MKNKKNKKRTKINQSKKKIIAIVLGVLAILVLVFLGLKMFVLKENIETEEKKIDLTGFPSSLSQIYEGVTVKYSSAWFHHKYNDKYSVFCTKFLLSTPAANGQSCKLITDSSQWDTPTGAAIGAIIKDVTGGKSGKMTDMKKYYYGELAINQYLYEMGKDPNNKIGSDANNSEVQRLVKLARAAYNDAKTTFDVTLSPTSPKLTLSGNYYISDTITVKGSSNYSVALSGVNGAEVYGKSGNTFKVRIPASKVTAGSSVSLTVKVTGTKTYTVAAKYNCGNGYQPVTPAIPIERKQTDSDQVTMSVAKTKVTIEKVDSQGNKIAGAILNLKSADGSYNKDFTSKTTAIVIENLPYGTYTLSEKSAPNGYVKSSETKKLTLSDKSLNVKGTITNNKTGFTVSKRSKTIDGEIAGAVLQITDSNGKVKAKWTTTTTKKSFSGFDVGTYYLEELQAPSGYKRFTGKIKFVIGNDGKITTNSGSDTEVVLVNEPSHFTVSKRAVDVEGEIPGAVLRIVDANGKEKHRWTTTKTKKSISLLPAGTYYLEELKAPSGYKKSDIRIKFVLGEDGKITTDSGSASEVVFINDPIEATFSKVDIANSKELPGAQLQILNEKGEEIKNSNGDVLYKWISTDKPYVISKISAGKYFLVETQEPEGYVKKEERIAFEIDQYGKIIVNSKEVDKVVMENEKTKVLISKQDVTTGKEIPGAELEVLDSEGNTLDKWISTEDPHMIEGLKVGKYYLIEKIAPKGYVLSTEKVEFEIKNDGTVGMVVMLNTPIVDVPNTASAASIIVSIIGVIAVGFGGWMIYRNVKKPQ